MKQRELTDIITDDLPKLNWNFRLEVEIEQVIPETLEDINTILDLQEKWVDVAYRLFYNIKK